ncbi:hypothetical protein BBJ28_00023231 [Nothophytophthora sp. Chile5]|nr:hypothetical protein BBJ28_00023231 [Nothophytophthora sp. Chile5]
MNEHEQIDYPGRGRGLSATDMPEETIRAGEVIEYYSPRFIMGDKRGHQHAHIVRVLFAEDPVNPIRLDTNELLSTTSHWAKRYVDASGVFVPKGQSLWRKLRTFKFIDGSVSNPPHQSHASMLYSGLQDATVSAFRSVRQREARALLPPGPQLTASVSAAAISDCNGGELVPESGKGGPAIEETGAGSANYADGIGNDVNDVVQARVSAQDSPARQDDAELQYQERDQPPVCSVSVHRERVSPHSGSEATSDAASAVDAHERAQGSQKVVAGAPIASATSRPEKMTRSRFAAVVMANRDARARRASRTSLTPAPSQATSTVAACSSDSALLAVSATGVAATGDKATGAAPPVLPAAVATSDATDDRLRAFLAIPTHTQRAKIRRQARSTACSYHKPKSRKRQYQQKRSVVRSGLEIHHAKSPKTTAMQEFIKTPGVHERLQQLRAKRPLFQKPAITEEGEGPHVRAVWPTDVTRITQSLNPDGVLFDDVDGDRCECHGDCYRDTCLNSLMHIYCTRRLCRLGAMCSNAPQENRTLQLCRTGNGLGVRTICPLEIGDFIGEYCGVLCPYDGVLPGQIAPKLKQNSGYTVLIPKMDTSGRFIYIEPKANGSISRFINHSCKPNAKFQMMQNRRNLKVMVMLLKSVPAGAEITVSYGDDLWFGCRCGQCSTSQTGGE